MTASPTGQTPATRGFFFADLRGYTAHLDRDGAAAAVDLLDRFRAVVRAEIERWVGAEIRTEGDSFYVVFPSASQAVRCALAVLEVAGPRGADIPIGIGVHAGEALDTPSGFVGTAVNISARLCALAGPGEVLASETVRELTRGVVDVSFEPRGRKRLKGIREPIAVFAVRATSGQGARPTTRLRATPRVTAIGTAVVLAAIVGLGLWALAPRTPANVGGGLPTTTPSATAAMTGTPTPSPSPTDAASPTPDSDALALLERFPTSLRARCVPVAFLDAIYAAGLYQAQTSLEADVPGIGKVAVFYEPEQGAHRAWFFWYRYHSGNPGFKIAKLGSDFEVPEGDCGAGSDARQKWSVGGAVAGSLVCIERDGHAWIYWTRTEGNILAAATRFDGDSETLFEFWSGIARFLE